jgi:hypothetical protein
MDDKKIRILILASNPWNTKPLGLDAEQQRIQNLWDNFDFSHERFDIRIHSAVRGEDLQEKILKFKPHLLHFSGHGENDSLIFADLSGDNAYEVSKQAIAQLFKSCAPDLKAVFLNACYSAKQADEIVEQVDYVIGMNAEINDVAAERFSQGFYTALFSQRELDIEQAFGAGLNQMDIAHIKEAEQKKPVLQKRSKTFVPSFKHDVFISFADVDAEWAMGLTDYLRKQLRQKLETADGFQLYTDNDLQQLEHSATLLVIASPAYSLQYQNHFADLEKSAKQQPVFLVEYDVCNPRPAFLNGFTPHKFWYYDEAKGMMQKITGDGYFAKANELVVAIADCLKELNSQHQHQQKLEQQRQQQQDNRELDNNEDSIDAVVFLHSAPEDLGLTAEILPLLDKKGIDYMLPLPRSEKTKAEEICQDIENNIRKCDAVLILYKESSPVWIREQLVSCRTLQRDRKTPLKIIAVHKGKEDDLRCSLKNFQIYDCPPEKAESYFPRFIKALKK